MNGQAFFSISAHRFCGNKTSDLPVPIHIAPMIIGGLVGDASRASHRLQKSPSPLRGPVSAPPPRQAFMVISRSQFSLIRERANLGNETVRGRRLDAMPR